jgi:hypothetical protein
MSSATRGSSSRTASPCPRIAAVALSTYDSESPSYAATVQGPVARVLAPERVGIGGERPAGKLEDLGEHRLDVERAQERGRGFEEQAEPLDLVGEEAVL